MIRPHCVHDLHAAHRALDTSAVGEVSAGPLVGRKIEAMEGATVIDQAIPYHVEVRVNSWTELENELDRAVEGAVEEALKNPGFGVRVTRHDQQTFSVELSHDVPHGTISELALYPPPSGV